jgi:molybdate transport system permease protein
VAIFDHVEALDYASAHFLSAAMLVFALVVLGIVGAVGRDRGAIGI